MSAAECNQFLLNCSKSPCAFKTGAMVKLICASYLSDDSTARSYVVKIAGGHEGFHYWGVDSILSNQMLVYAFVDVYNEEDILNNGKYFVFTNVQPTNPVVQRRNVRQALKEFKEFGTKADWVQPFSLFHQKLFGWLNVTDVSELSGDLAVAHASKMNYQSDLFSLRKPKPCKHSFFEDPLEPGECVGSLFMKKGADTIETQCKWPQLTTCRGCGIQRCPDCAQALEQEKEKMETFVWESFIVPPALRHYNAEVMVCSHARAFSRENSSSGTYIIHRHADHFEPFYTTEGFGCKRS